MPEGNILNSPPSANRRALLVCAASAAACMPVSATKNWPARSLRLMVAYPPGGVSDDIARHLAVQLGLQLDVPVVVENRAGAGGALAMGLLARALPDGYTLCFCAISPLSLLPHLGPVSYHPVNDIAPVASVMFTPVLVVGTPLLQVKSFAEMLALAHALPGSLRWATSGTGTAGHMVLEQVRRASAAELTHIPYKGGGQQLSDALSGQFELLSTNVGAQQLDHIRNGRLKPLAVGAPERLTELPDVPTLAELGFANANLGSLFGIFAPARTSPSVLHRLNAEINRALAAPGLRNRLMAVNNVPAGGSAESFTLQIKSASEANRRLLKFTGPALR